MAWRRRHHARKRVATVAASWRHKSWRNARAHALASRLSRSNAAAAENENVTKTRTLTKKKNRHRTASACFGWQSACGVAWRMAYRRHRAIAQITRRAANAAWRHRWAWHGGRRHHIAWRRSARRVDGVAALRRRKPSRRASANMARLACAAALQQRALLKQTRRFIASRAHERAAHLHARAPRGSAGA